MSRADRSMSWYDFACEYVDLKWPRVAGTTRRTHAEALTPVTAHMWADTRGMPDAALLRSALGGWAFNTPRRAGELPPEVADALRWARRHSRPVAALADPEMLRGVLAGLSTRLDGQPYAPSVASRRRKILNAAVEYAVERKLLDANPIPALKWTPPRAVEAVNKRRVANPVQVRSLLRAVEEQARSGPRLVAFFGCLYFARMRPDEAVSLRLRHLELPECGWGRLHLDGAESHAGKAWTDSGDNRDSRQLKQRERAEVRSVPLPAGVDRAPATASRPVRHWSRRPAVHRRAERRRAAGAHDRESVAASPGDRLHARGRRFPTGPGPVRPPAGGGEHLAQRDAVIRPTLTQCGLDCGGGTEHRGWAWLGAGVLPSAATASSYPAAPDSTKRTAPSGRLIVANVYMSWRMTRPFPTPRLGPKTTPWNCGGSSDGRVGRC